MESDLILRVSGLSFFYPGGPPVLQSLDFDVAAGESIGVVGPNGAGKTTLFLCLAGALSPPKKSVCVAGLDPGDRANRSALPSKIGIVFQNSDDQLFNASVYDDVAFGPLNLQLPAEAVRERVAEAIERVHLQGLEDRVPFHLSSGEKRRAAIAGVLALRPEVLLIDEPSAHLDPRGRRELIRLLNSLEGTKLLASHDLELILQTCRRAIVLDAGKLMADGPVEKLFADKALMEAHGLEVPHSLTFHHPRHDHT
jgi:cobalt/nickel transport system ATP-binding protein